MHRQQIITSLRISLTANRVRGELLQLAKDFERLHREWQYLEVIAERLEPASSAHFDKSTHTMEALWRDRKEAGYEEAVSIASDKVDEVDVVANRMRELPAQTLQGLAAKARLAQFDAQPRSFVDMAGPERDWDWDVLCLEKFIREIERFAADQATGGLHA